jgi:hypothetical protein
MTAVASPTLAGCHVGSRLRVQEEEGGGSDLAVYPRWSGNKAEIVFRVGCGEIEMMYLTACYICSLFFIFFFDGS